MKYLLRTKTGKWYKVNKKTYAIEYTEKITEENFLTAEEIKKCWRERALKALGKVTKLYSYEGPTKKNYFLKDVLIVSNNAKEYIKSGALSINDNRVRTTVSSLVNASRDAEKIQMEIKTPFECQIDSIETIANESTAKKADKPNGSVQGILASITNAKELLEDEKNYDNYVLTEVDRLITDTLHYVSLHSAELKEAEKLKLFDLLQGAVKRRSEVHTNELYRGLLSTMLSSKTENVLELLETYGKIKKQKYVPRMMMDFFDNKGKVVLNPYIPTFEEWAEEILVQKKDNFSSSKTLESMEEAKKAEEKQKPLQEYTLFDLFPEFLSELDECDNPREVTRRLTKLLEGNGENETRDIKQKRKQRKVTTDACVGNNQRSQLNTYEDEQGILHFAGSTMTVPAYEFRQLVSEIKNGLISHEDAASQLNMKLPNFEALYKTYVRRGNGFSKQQVIKADATEFNEFKQFCLDTNTTIQQMISFLLNQNNTPEMAKLDSSKARVSTVGLRVDDYKSFYDQDANRGKDLSLCLGQLIHEFVQSMHKKAEAVKTSEPLDPSEFLENHPDTTCPICGSPMKAIKKNGGVLVCRKRKCNTQIFPRVLNINLTEKDMEEVLKQGRSTTLVSTYNPVWFGTDDIIKGTFELKDSDGLHEVEFVKHA